MRQGVRPTLASVLFFLMAPAWASAGSGDGQSPPSLPLVPDSLIGDRIAPLLLLSRADIRADVGLDPRQTAELERAIAEHHARAAALRGKSGSSAVAARREIDESMQRWIDAHLSEAQRVRLIQIELWWEGPSALVTRPIVADTLSLTHAQRQTLGGAVNEYRQKRRSGTLRPEDVEHLAKLSFDILNEEQRLRYNEMRGRPIKLETAVVAGANGPDRK
jgi:hypothetical protein